ncbi:MFS transporter [Pseudomonas luteola]
MSVSSLWSLDLLRALQGACAAATLAGGSATLAASFDDQNRLRAFSFLGASFGLGLAFGPSVAGYLVNAYGWRSVFMAISSLGVLALILGMVFLQQSRSAEVHKLDWAGLGSFSLALGLLVWGVMHAMDYGVLEKTSLLCLALSTFCLLGFIRIERNALHPALDLALLRDPRFLGIQALPVATCLCFVVLLVILPIRFITVERFTPAISGSLLMALSLPLLIMPAVAVRLTRTIKPATLTTAGLFIAAAGVYWVSRLPLGTPVISFVLPLVVIGTGTGLPWGLMDGLSIAIVSKEKIGMATGIFNTTRVASEALVMALVFVAMSVLISQELATHAGKITVEDIDRAARAVAVGQLAQASHHLPELSVVRLKHAYITAFQQLLAALSGLTVILASLVRLSLDRRVGATSGKMI